MVFRIKILIFIAVALVGVNAHALSIGFSKTEAAKEAAEQKSCKKFAINIKLEKGQACLSCNDVVCIVGELAPTQPQRFRSLYKNYNHALFAHSGDMIQPFIYNHLSFSKEPSGTLLRAVKKNLVGFVDVDGNTVIDFKYRRAGDFNSGLACVVEKPAIPEKSSCAYINNKGDIVISEGLWRSSGNFHEGLAFVENNEEKYGYINTKGEVAIPFKLRHSSNFKAGRAVIETDAGFGYIDKQGEIAITPQYPQAHPFDEGKAAAVKGPKGWGFIDVDGEPLTEMIYQHVDKQFVDGLAEVQLGNCRSHWSNDDPDQECRRGLVAPSGYAVMPTEFISYVPEESNGRKLIIAKKLGEIVGDVYYCVYDYLGTVLAECIYGEIDLKGNHIYARKTRTIDVTYKVRKPTDENGVRNRRTDRVSLAGVLDLNGNEVVPFKYKKVEALKGGNILAETDTKRITYDAYGNILKTQYLK